jgi:iron complex outermembrane receptor protein
MTDTRPTTIRFAIHRLLCGGGAAMLLAASGAAEAQQQESTSAETVETITITGSSIQSSPVALDTTAQPIQFIPLEKFEQTSGESIGDYLRELPINNGFSSSPTTDEYAGGNTSINLRAIGDQYTLVLVEGRRFGGEDVPDIGALPAEAIEGIEILKGGASSVYGSDAVAGVVNIRLKDDFNGVELYGSYGDTTRRDASFVRTAALFGLARERFSLTGSLSYQNRQGISKFDRELTSSRDYRRFGGLDRRSGNIAVPHKIYLSSDVDGVNPLSLDLDSFSPGESGAGAGDFIAFNRDRQAYSTNEYGTYPAFNRVSGHWSAKYEIIEDKLSLFTRGYADRRKQQFIANPPILETDVPASNPYNPFGEDVYVYYLLGPNESGLMTEYFNIRNVLGTAGLQGTVGRLNYEVAFSSYRKRIGERYENDIDLSALPEAVSRTDATAFNPFGYWANSPEQLAGLSPTARYVVHNEVDSVDAKIDGKLFDWYAGSAFFALGVEKRDVKYSYDPDQVWQDVEYWWLGNGGDPVERSRDVKAYFGEVRVPLYDAGDAAFLQNAEVTAAVRSEDYSDFGSSTVGQFSARLAFLDERLILRGSYAESFKAPSLEDLYEPIDFETEPGGFYFDPVRGGFFPVDLIVGGNPDLDAESGETVNLGLVVRPRADSSLVFTLDYWMLELSDIIAEADGQALLDGTATGGSITRDEDDYPTLDVRLDNGGKREVNGIDIGATYRVQAAAGDFTFELNSTYMTRFEDSGNGIVTDYLGLWSGTVGPIPTLRALAGVSWERGRWEANGYVNFSNGYDDIIPDVISREVSSYKTFDAQVAYDFGDAEGFLGGTRVYFGIENLFDADLPFVASSSDGWDRYIADYRGRYAYAGVRKKF